MSSKLTVSLVQKNQFKLSGDLNRETVMHCWPEQAEIIQSAAQAKQSLTVNLSSVEAVDTAGLAWLMHLVRDCQAAEVPLAITQAPTGLVNLAKLSNVDPLLPLQ
ncbi:STAS domain-containing protein [Aliiglaciecola sp. LCG003]|uniref:STAS domain-containing protein n=1 Tax=Aliiglaciecola sp. LCG003 TaxID=3053655 RepID=UPI002572D633|nr:STAS domain-containing protein [Aliiglaciecola sp. LCG003]WJG08856.1 STAS domain-containing protein [Aliiglaciecola sp. LCG003]